MHYPYNSKTDRILENSWAEDTSTYSDSPPIETQGYRFLSQLTRNEANLDQQDGSFSTDNSKQTDNTTFSNFGSRSHLNPVYDKRHTSIGYEHDEGLKQNKNNRLQMSKRSLETGSEISIDSFKDTADESTGFSTPTFVLNTDIADPIRGNEPFMYTAEKIVSEKGISEVTVTETSSFSQSLFSQDSLSGHTVTPNKKRAPKTKACVTKRKRFEKSELKTNTFHIEKSNGQSTSLSLSDMHIENNEDAILDITKPQALNRQHNCVYATDRAKRTGAAGKDRDTHLVDNYSSHGGNRDSFKLSAEIDPKLEKKIHVPSFHAIGLVQSIDNIHLDEESPFLTNNLKLKECGTHTPVRKQPDIESPFRQCGAGKDVYDIFKISSKKDSASLIKRYLYPPQTVFVGGYTFFMLSIQPTDRPCVRNILFP